jgi:hypothetical protein
VLSTVMFTDIVDSTATAPAWGTACGSGFSTSMTTCWLVRWSAPVAGSSRPLATGPGLSRPIFVVAVCPSEPDARVPASPPVTTSRNGPDAFCRSFRMVQVTSHHPHHAPASELCESPKASS